MRWPWRRKRSDYRPPIRSPFDAERLGPGDPGWEIFEAAMKTGGAVVGVYNSETGEVVSITPIGEEEP